VDLTVGYDSSNPPSFKPRLPLSSGHMIQFRAENEDQLYIVLTIRTSGTEPKVGHRNGFRYGDSFCFRLSIILKAMAEIVRPLQNFYPVLLKSLEMFGSRLRNTVWVPLDVCTGIFQVSRVSTELSALPPLSSPFPIWQHSHPSDVVTTHIICPFLNRNHFCIVCTNLASVMRCMRSFESML
jgi:hypothetical protein